MYHKIRREYTIVSSAGHHLTLGYTDYYKFTIIIITIIFSFSFYFQAIEGIMLKLFVLPIITICLLLTSVNSGVPIGK